MRSGVIAALFVVSTVDQTAQVVTGEGRQVVTAHRPGHRPQQTAKLVVGVMGVMRMASNCGHLMRT